ncbi:hypothetical protein MKX03_006008 [Papaver bracteatum]|nr:hypothetical protein MKX03_006008 [Papaver bracteatum]
MKVIAAYLLAVLGGNKEPNAEDIKNILASVGAADDSDDRIRLLLSQVKKLFVCGGAAARTVANAIGDGGADCVAEHKKVEKVEDKIDEDSDDEYLVFDPPDSF